MGGSPVTLTSILILTSMIVVALLLWVRHDNEMEESSSRGSTGSKWKGVPDSAPRAEFVSRIFSREDREFVVLLGSPRLLRMYGKERSAVAVDWARRTSRDVSRIMRRHRLSSRHSRNLDVATETKLLLQYLRLRFICGLLVLLIRSFGPYALSDLAAYTSELYQGIGRMLPEGSLTDRLAAADDTKTY